MQQPLPTTTIHMFKPAARSRKIRQTLSSPSPFFYLRMKVAAMMEEVRVLVLACGHLLADDFEGESPAIPEPLHHLCFQQPGTVATCPTFSSLLLDTINTIMLLSKMLIQVHSQHSSLPPQPSPSTF